MRRRLSIFVLITLVCWFAISLLSLGGRPEDFWHHFAQVFQFDEELLVFSCFLLFSIAFSVHVLAVGWRAPYRQRFLFPQLGLLYAFIALFAGSMIRRPLRDPFETQFIVVFTLLAIGGFAAIFGRRFARILRRETN